jgi:hypothetical protein
VTLVERVGSGVHRIGTDWVGSFLSEVDGALTVVDCGFPGYYEQIPAAV